MNRIRTINLVFISLCILATRTHSWGTIPPGGPAGIGNPYTPSLPAITNGGPSIPTPPKPRPSEPPTPKPTPSPNPKPPDVDTRGGISGGGNTESTPPPKPYSSLSSADQHVQHAQADKAQRLLEKAAESLDAARQHMEEWGFMGSSQPMILKDMSDFAAVKDTQFSSTSSYINQEQNLIQGTASESLTNSLVVQGAAALAGMAAPSSVPLPSLPTPPSLPAPPAAPSATSTTPAPAVAAPATTSATQTVSSTTSTTQQTTAQTTKSATPATGTAAPATPAATPTPVSSSSGGIGLPIRQSILNGFGDKETELISLFHIQPNQKALFNDPNMKVFLGIIQVSCSPGWRTKRDYIGDLSVSFEYIARFSNGETITSLNWDKPVQPQVFAVLPLIDSQSLDLSNSRNDSINILLQALASMPGAADSVKASLMTEYIRNFQKNAHTRNAIPVINSYTTTTGAGFRFSPSFMAISDTDADESDSGNVLLPASFPAAVLIGMEQSDLNNSYNGIAIKLPSPTPTPPANAAVVDAKEMGPVDTSLTPDSSTGGTTTLMDLSLSTEVTSKWSLREHEFIFPKKSDAEDSRMAIATRIDQALNQLSQVSSNLIETSDRAYPDCYSNYYTRLNTLQNEAWDLRNRVLGTENYQSIVSGIFSVAKPDPPAAVDPKTVFTIPAGIGLTRGSSTQFVISGSGVSASNVYGVILDSSVFCPTNVVGNSTIIVTVPAAAQFSSDAHSASVLLVCQGHTQGLPVTGTVSIPADDLDKTVPQVSVERSDSGQITKFSFNSKSGIDLSKLADLLKALQPAPPAAAQKTPATPGAPQAPVTGGAQPTGN